ncbi:MarR family winged helix-turn-helix transcriptional regulator [Kibdelosporangium phytohabitans]|uniref:MarR family transcriptional regulator n=1 Tax=Kibdelosporangium phytohabitans TaxID=860235 RepID=A0A0N9IG24_9PSEU|nr:MarR family transcriptional regulator [Kibdelosporangium phytohabitans]ALG15485.1 MarR family transcriptional regulator [Kibdelosporangium phytohabitans]MBE1464261.1 DNA-binding MarR family transcriptional regulator [Kibdelosporangium phytohabitans]
MAEPDPRNFLLLDEQACFALYAASRAVTDVYRPLLAELDLTYPQYLVLLVLWERDNQPIKQIGTALHLDYGTVSPLLKRLETRGLVQRKRQADDERSVAVSLTREGIALRERALEIPPAIGCALGLDDQGRRALIDLLRDVTATARSAATGTSPEGDH